VIIGLLVIIVGILLYPRFFGTPRLNAMTFPITVVNEFGEKETHRVFKEDYLTRLMIFPFRNETEDSSKNWLQYGILEGIYEDLAQFNNIALTWNDPVNLQEQLEFAKADNYPHFLTGNFRMNDGGFEISSRLYRTVNGSVIAERDFRGSDFFKLMDSISLQTRIDLNISNNLLNSLPDLPFKEHHTANFDAFQYYTIGCYYYYYEDSFAYYLNKAIKLDPSFALALYLQADHNYKFQSSRESAERDINQAMDHRKRLLQHHEIRTRILYHLIHGDIEKAITLAEMEHELNPYDVRVLENLIHLYSRNFLIRKWEKAVLELNDMLPDRPAYQIRLARTYRFTGKFNKGISILEKLLNEDPRNTEALFQLAEIYLHKNDLENAEELYNRARLLHPEMEEYCSLMLDHCAYVRDNLDNSSFHAPYVGNYRLESSEFSTIVSIHNSHLLFGGENQIAHSCYPLSDTQYISAYISDNEQVKLTFLKNGNGRVYKLLGEQRGSFTFWKEDSLILKAREHLNNNNHNEALSAFRKAYDQNPEHYYLSNYIQHLEYIQSPEYEESKIVLESYTGDYGTLKIFLEKDQFFYKNFSGFIFKLLPIDDDQFMIPSSLYRLFRIEKEDDRISGLRMVYYNREDEFYSKSSR
jgi:tetratricopeptide (TPR) repeat protein